MKKVYEAPEFLSEEVLSTIDESFDNTIDDPIEYDNGDEPNPYFEIKS